MYNDHEILLRIFTASNTDNFNSKSGQTKLIFISFHSNFKVTKAKIYSTFFLHFKAQMKTLVKSESVAKTDLIVEQNKNLFVRLPKTETMKTNGHFLFSDAKK